MNSTQLPTTCSEGLMKGCSFPVLNGNIGSIPTREGQYVTLGKVTDFSISGRLKETFGRNYSLFFVKNYG